MCFVIFILSRITSTGSLLIRSTACIMTYLVIITVGYVIFVLIRVVYAGDIYSAFTFFMSPGPFRVVFLTVDKIIDTLFYLFVRKSLSKISTLKKKYQMVLMMISLTAYISTQYLFHVFLDTANDALSAVAIFSWLYILFGMCKADIHVIFEIIKNRNPILSCGFHTNMITIILDEPVVKPLNIRVDG